MIDVAEAKALSPLISTDGLLAAAYSPTDGHCTPESVVSGYAGAARRAGARIVRNCAVTAIDSSGGAITEVVTEHGNDRHRHGHLRRRRLVRGTRRHGRASTFRSSRCAARS